MVLMIFTDDSEVFRVHWIYLFFFNINTMVESFSGKADLNLLFWSSSKSTKRYEKGEYNDVRCFSILVHIICWLNTWIKRWEYTQLHFTWKFTYLCWFWERIWYTLCVVYFLLVSLKLRSGLFHFEHNRNFRIVVSIFCLDFYHGRTWYVCGDNRCRKWTKWTWTISSFGY